jgi:hypothetical protein
MGVAELKDSPPISPCYRRWSDESFPEPKRPLTPTPVGGFAGRVAPDAYELSAFGRRRRRSPTKANNSRPT